MTVLLTAFLLAHFEASAVWWWGFGIWLALSSFHEFNKR